MKKQFAIIGIIILLVTVGLSGCNTSSRDEDKFIGSWKGTYSYGGNFTRKVPVTIMFLSDGTYSASLPMIIDNGTWNIEDGKFDKTIDSEPTVVYSYSFANNNTSLLLTSSSQSEQWNLTKQ